MCVCYDKRADHHQLASYTYLRSEVNQDFEEGRAALTAFNCRRNQHTSAATPTTNTGSEKSHSTVHDFKVYANLCGLLALPPALATAELDRIHTALVRAGTVVPPAFD
jgi:hypothetical protein